MALILGVFDLLAYAIPGSLYLAIFAYASHRAGWIDVPSVLAVPSLLLLIAVAVAAFLIGQASYAARQHLDRLNPFGSATCRRKPRRTSSDATPPRPRVGSSGPTRSRSSPPSRRTTTRPPPRSPG